MSYEVVESIARTLSREAPRGGPRGAAVSVILSGRSAPEILFIRRAERSNDPWSGQIAFPGGRAQPRDGDPRSTACRETSEEVGIDLDAVAEFLGYAGPVTTHTGAIDVVPCAFLLRARGRVVLNDEVASYRWARVRDILSKDAKTTHRLETPGGSVEMPAIRVADYVIWGLTYRILVALLGLPEPV